MGWAVGFAARSSAQKRVPPLRSFLAPVGMTERPDATSRVSTGACATGGSSASTLRHNTGGQAASGTRVQIVSTAYSYAPLPTLPARGRAISTQPSREGEGFTHHASRINLQLSRAGAPGHRLLLGGRRLRACRSAWWRGWRGPEAPGPHGGRRRSPTGAWRSCGAERVA